MDTRVNTVLRDEAVRYREEVPFSQHLTGEDGEQLNEPYYLQYRIDDIHRIWGTACIDSLALSQLIRIDYDAAREWGHYTVEEMNHDKLFLLDLATHGITEEDVVQTPLLPSTQNILDFLENSIRKEGPLAALAYSLFLEQGSEQSAAKTVANIKQHYGEHAAQGAHAHLHIDGDEQHYEMVMRVARSVLDKRTEGVGRLITLLQHVGELFRGYYCELYRMTVVEQSAPVNTLLMRHGQ